VLTVATGTLTNAGAIQTVLGTNAHQLNASVANQGTISVDLRSLTINSTVDFSNSGTVTVGSGLTLTASGGAFTNTTTGTIEGAGTIDVSSGAQFINLGTVGPGDATTPLGRLTFVDFLPFDTQGDLNVELDGLTPGSEHDQVAVSGSATLNGTLNVTFLGGYTPQDGDAFTILTCSGSCTGFFEIENLPDLSGLGLDGFVTYTGAEAVYEVIAP
jgi:hypothetical protein